MLLYIYHVKELKYGYWVVFKIIEYPKTWFWHRLHTTNGFVDYLRSLYSFLPKQGIIFKLLNKVSRAHVLTQNTLFIEYFFKMRLLSSTLRTQVVHTLKKTFILVKGNPKRKFALETEIRSLYLLCIQYDVGN